MRRRDWLDRKTVIEQKLLFKMVKVGWLKKENKGKDRIENENLLKSLFY